MTIIKDTFFGGAEKKAAKAQTASLREAQNILQQNFEKGSDQATNLFQSGEQNLLGGFQGALDLFGQSAPAQAQAFQGGNVGAQQQLLAGLPLQQAAILGQPVDFSQLQPFQQNVDLGFLQQQLPQMTSISQALGIGGVSADPQRPPVPNVGTPIPIDPRFATGGFRSQAQMEELQSLAANPNSQQNVLGGRGGNLDFFNRGIF